jgi:hypothetical protein
MGPTPRHFRVLAAAASRQRILGAPQERERIVGALIIEL